MGNFFYVEIKWFTKAMNWHEFMLYTYILKILNCFYFITKNILHFFKFRFDYCFYVLKMQKKIILMTI